MAYTLPTLEQFKTRFPTVVVGKSDELLQMYLDEAAAQVDTSWREADYQLAIMLLAAHNIVSEDTATSGGGGGSAGSGIVASESFGGMSISYEGSGSGQDPATSSPWGSTEYGRRFYNLLKLNKPAIVSI